MKLKFSNAVFCMLSCVGVHGQLIPVGPLLQGQCANKEAYKLQAYRLEQAQSGYKGYFYEGPLGKGAILSSVSEQEALAYVCKESAKGRWIPEDGDDQ